MKSVPVTLLILRRVADRVGRREPGVGRVLVDAVEGRVRHASRVVTRYAVRSRLEIPTPVGYGPARCVSTVRSTRGRRRARGG